MELAENDFLLDDYRISTMDLRDLAAMSQAVDNARWEHVQHAHGRSSIDRPQGIMNDIPDGLNLVDERFGTLEHRPDGEPTVLRMGDAWPDWQSRPRADMHDVQIASPHGLSMSAAVALSLIWAVNVFLAFIAGCSCGR